MIVHAAGESGPAPDGTYAVLLQARDEADIRLLGALPGAHLIVETEGPHAGQAMAVGFAPAPGKRPDLSCYRLWEGGSGRGVK